ncbi:D-sedoheptulose 7-phosphate isomerase [Heliobacterium gestii]|nr:D-sedoheptulose 7-phosphate isomerase [Heliomicrobium gestii]
MISKMKESIEQPLLQLAAVATDTLRRGKKIVLLGNGGSAADCQHIAAELVGRFQRQRRALPAIALTTDTSILTAVGNDFGIEAIFVRQVEALVQEKDLVIALSTSGSSPNVLLAVEAARAKQAITAGLTGAKGGALAELCDLAIQAPSDVAARIQEAHILIGHILCELIEKEFADGR